MESAHVLFVAGRAWICTGDRGEHNRKTPARITRVANDVDLIHTPSLKAGQIVSVETGERETRPSRTVIDLPAHGLGVLVAL